MNRYGVNDFLGILEIISDLAEKYGNDVVISELAFFAGSLASRVDMEKEDFLRICSTAFDGAVSNIFNRK